jgi:hypothetical protein
VLRCFFENDRFNHSIAEVIKFMDADFDPRLTPQPSALPFNIAVCARGETTVGQRARLGNLRTRKA